MAFQRKEGIAKKEGKGGRRRRTEIYEETNKETKKERKKEGKKERLERTKEERKRMEIRMISAHLFYAKRSPKFRPGQANARGSRELGGIFGMGRAGL